MINLITYFSETASVEAKLDRTKQIQTGVKLSLIIFIKSKLTTSKIFIYCSAGQQVANRSSFDDKETEQGY